MVNNRIVEGFKNRLCSIECHPPERHLSIEGNELIISSLLTMVLGGKPVRFPDRFSLKASAEIKQLLLENIFAAGGKPAEQQGAD